MCKASLALAKFENDMKHNLKESGNQWRLFDILVGFVGLQTSSTCGSLGPRINKSKASQFEDVRPFPGLGHDHDGMRLKQELSSCFVHRLSRCCLRHHCSHVWRTWPRQLQSAQRKKAETWCSSLHIIAKHVTCIPRKFIVSTPC